ncbi:MAG: hypothetical protein COU07_02895 [Candidatus Harrisonbacteria bacterium CG10_big_fil_rev_8_21_14_0_10_40_38]|uniref:ABC3 transporter permease C-terminal domain-containing protein n=1 Tax=Candidatus Harrisonbacteria bacterium CG10_big_fil_rev_8_21_14_0_10_40_38 TaxID=1974583 RepID=A0A2H0US14_9BACT|nr:MAG: hypothetical protein COU07_02895 [Candidatus Harrisonbacteria bacterium CG10_big_fil_rev_8_21_14_0_10_40_38]
MSAKKLSYRISNFFAALRVGFFLAVRQVRRSSLWMNILVIAIMTLTFLNLVVVSGVLVGLIQGAVRAVQEHYIGEIFITNLKDKPYIERSTNIISFAESLPSVRVVAPRYVEGGVAQSNYKKAKKSGELREEAGTLISGIDPIAEDEATGLSSLLIEGSYLEPDDFDQVLVGALLLRQYLEFDSAAFPALEDVGVGSKIRVTVAGNTREVIVKGIIKSKVDELDRRIFFPEKQFRSMIGRNDFNVDEIAIRLEPETDQVAIKNAFLAQGFGDYARIQTQTEAEPKFLQDIKKTFNLLGSMISSIGVFVAAITIFIIFFINAITRRKFIGILKGIGINPLAIECAYVLQALFYVFFGTLIGSVIVFGFLEPYISAHPINFPFSDGILVVPLGSTILRIAILLVVTLVAGFLPAKIITRQNTVDAILNR